MSLRPQRLTVYSCMRLTTADSGPKDEAIVFSSTYTTLSSLSRSCQRDIHLTCNLHFLDDLACLLPGRLTPQLTM